MSDTSRADVQQDWEQDTPHQVMLAVARVDPWTVMKVSFMLSVAFAIATVIASFVIWLMLDGMHVFADIEHFLVSIGAESFVKLLDYARLPQVMSMATLVGVVNIVILTALSTLGALIYNLVAALVGGVRVTLMDE
ncbi:DUF3566 domain-containing protein [Actinomyces sp.]|uniref:DUF3566 domain-containing protein n=1 Tax=Actinomyces sp. TaxID=29317 RepID=UPI0029118C0F|nr:DUF3566 domain-containing protein [Actinomyces sp.]MDU5231238.1 DUF3566 domain-containing protein [Actinomyces sp.]MDU6756739.1 DUF3566 domain-containing protein [Actinomyces sp.]